jgi:hypothetical protein
MAGRILCQLDQGLLPLFAAVVGRWVRDITREPVLWVEPFPTSVLDLVRHPGKEAVVEQSINILALVIWAPQLVFQIKNRIMRCRPRPTRPAAHSIGPTGPHPFRQRVWGLVRWQGISLRPKAA